MIDAAADSSRMPPTIYIRPRGWVSEERGGRKTTSFQSVRRVLPPRGFSRDYRSDGRGSGNTIPRPQERRHFHNIQMYKSAGPKPLENEKGRGSAHRRREIRRRERDGGRRGGGGKRKEGTRARKIERRERKKWAEG